MNQRYTSKCHAHSRAAGLYTAFSAAGIALPFVPSPELIAECTYADDRAAATPVGQALQVMRDVGAELQSSSDATRRWGLAPIQPVSSDMSIYTDCPDNTAMPGPDGQLPALPEVDVARVQIAASKLTLPEYQLAGAGASVTALVLASLDTKVPLQVGGPVGPAYEALAPGQVAMAEPDGDGHAQVVDSYRPMTDAERSQCGSKGTYLFEVNGSWGLDFANFGVAYVSEEWIEANWNYFPLIVVPS